MRKYIIVLTFITFIFIVGCSIKGTEDDSSISDMLSPNISYLRSHLSGKILTLSGTNILKKGIQVFLGSKALKKSWDTKFVYTPMQKALTNSSGKYEFYNIIPGRYLLYAIDNSVSPALSGTLEVELTEGGKENVNININNSNSVIIGKVTDSGINQPNMEVILQFDGSDTIYNSVWTNSQGEFAFVTTPTLSPIDIIVKDSNEVTFSQRKNIDMTAGKYTELNIVPTLQTSSNHFILKGVVKDGKTDKVVDNATLKISNHSDSFYTVSQTDGSYEFDLYSNNNLSYDLEVKKTGFRDFTKTVEFGDSKEISLEIPMAYNLAGGYFNIIGTAYDNSNNIYTNQSVQLKAYDTDEVSIDHLLYSYKTNTDANGNFVFTDIAKTNISGRDSFFYVWLKDIDFSTVEVSVTATDLTYVVELRVP